MVTQRLTRKAADDDQRFDVARHLAAAERELRAAYRIPATYGAAHQAALAASSQDRLLAMANRLRHMKYVLEGEMTCADAESRLDAVWKKEEFKFELVRADKLLAEGMD